jgi:hypothetical protein
LRASSGPASACPMKLAEFAARLRRDWRGSLDSLQPVFKDPRSLGRISSSGTPTDC